MKLSTLRDKVNNDLISEGVSFFDDTDTDKFPELQESITKFVSSYLTDLGFVDVESTILKNSDKPYRVDELTISTVVKLKSMVVGEMISSISKTSYTKPSRYTVTICCYGTGLLNASELVEDIRAKGNEIIRSTL